MQREMKKPAFETFSLAFGNGGFVTVRVDLQPLRVQPGTPALANLETTIEWGCQPRPEDIRVFLGWITGICQQLSNDHRKAITFAFVMPNRSVTVLHFEPAASNSRREAV